LLKRLAFPIKVEKDNTSTGSKQRVVATGIVERIGEFVSQYSLFV